MARRSYRVQIRGLPELRRAMRGLDPEIRRALRTDLRAAALPVLERARALAPVRAGRGGGALKRSIRLRTRAHGVAIGSRLEYAPIVENAIGAIARVKSYQRYGSETVRAHDRRVPGKAFLKPAVDQTQDAVIRGAELAITRAVDRLFAQGRSVG